MQQAGYWWELSMAQVEVSRTIVFTQPRHARAFFEALVTDNLDLGRPDTVEIVFGRRIINGQQRATRGTFKTKVITRGTEVTINAFYRHSRIKQYLKDGRALRIETVINSPTDLRIGRRLHNLANSRTPGVRSTTGCCTLNVPSRAASLRITSVQALAGALFTGTGITNACLMTGLLGPPTPGPGLL